MPVVLLCHFDGTNGSTTFTDVSPSAHALTATNATVSTTSPKFGTGSADLTAAGGRIVVTGTTADWNFGSGPFTVEAWAYFTSAPTAIHGVLTQFGGSINLGWFLGLNGATFNFFYSTTGTDNPAVSAAFSPTLNQWYHLAADRDAANVLRVYVNGAVVASATVSASIFASTQNCMIGNDANLDRHFPGLLDEARIVKGTAMYGGAFTPPTGPFGFTTWSTTDKSASMTLSGGNLIATAAASPVSVRAVHPKRTGKYYIEYLSTTTQNNASGFGFGTARTPLGVTALASAFIVQAQIGSNAAYDNFAVLIGGLGAQSGGVTTSTLVCAAINLDAGLIWFRMSAAGIWNTNAANNPATGVGGISLSGTGLGQGIDVYPFLVLGAPPNSVTANFGASAFTGAVPAGFTSGWDDSVAVVTNEVVTQVGVEEWGSSVPAMQATQVGIEEWGTSANPTAVTQVSAEHWAAASPDAAITQALVEHWGTVSTISTQAVVTQVLVEHWVPAAVVSTARPRRLVCISG